MKHFFFVVNTQSELLAVERFLLSVGYYREKFPSARGPGHLRWLDQYCCEPIQKSNKLPIVVGDDPNFAFHQPIRGRPKYYLNKYSKTRTQLPIEIALYPDQYPEYYI